MRPEKISIVSEIRSQVAGSSFLILANHTGINVGQAKELRKRLAKQKSQYHVVKVSYFKKAVSDMPEFKVDENLSLPLAIVFGKNDGIEAAKILDAFKREHKVLAIDSGFINGRRFSGDDFDQLIKLPSRTTLLGMLAGGLAAPMSGLAGVMRQKVASIVYALQAVQELKGKSSSK